MAYVAPTTKTTGTLITAAIWNQDVVDNQNAAFPLGVAAWTAYTPALTSVTLGNGTLAGKYARVGRIVVVSVNLTFGSTTAFTGNPRFGLPVTGVGAQVGVATLIDSGTRTYVAAAQFGTAANVELVHTESGNFGIVNATNPFTWTTGDSLSITMTFEAAS